MEELLRRNASGELAPCPRTGGYLVDGKKRCGITTWLHRKLGLYGSARIKKKGKRRAPEPYTPARASSKRTGTAFHRQVHHSLFCSSRRCRCKRAFGTRTNTQSKKGTPCYDLVKQALQALLELRLKPVCAEQVIAAHDAPVATQFDLICRDEHKKTVLVSWKTGCASMARAPALLDPAVMFAERHTASEHVAQISAEMAMLKDSHGVKVDRACIIYVQRLKRQRKQQQHATQYRACFLPRSWVARRYRTEGWRYLLDRHRKRKRRTAVHGRTKRRRKATK